MQADSPEPTSKSAYGRTLHKLRELVDISIWFVKNGFEDPKQAKKKLINKGLPIQRAETLFGKD